MHPELKDLGASEEAIDALEQALIEAWETIDSTIIKACLESIWRRRDAVITAEGWRTQHQEFRNFGIFKLY